MSIIWHIDLFSPLWKYSLNYFIWTPKVLQSMGTVFLTTHSHGECGWKIPCISMAWILLIDLREYMCMTHPKYSIYGRKWTFWRSRMVTWPSLPVCPIALSLVWKFGWRNIKSISLIRHAIYSKIIWKRNEKKCMETVGNSAFFEHRVNNFIFLLRLAITP